MARRFEINMARQNRLGTFTKQLVRRSKAHCELCAASNTDLQIHELNHDAEYTEAAHCLFLCETCMEQILKPKKMNAQHWHCLRESIWSEIPAVQAGALTLLRRLSDKEDWATQLLEEVYIDAETEAWADLNP